MVDLSAEATKQNKTMLVRSEYTLVYRASAEGVAGNGMAETVIIQKLRSSLGAGNKSAF